MICTGCVMNTDLESLEDNLVRGLCYNDVVSCRNCSTYSRLVTILEGKPKCLSRTGGVHPVKCSR